jgi:ankyrin repeat protein
MHIKSILMSRWSNVSSAALVAAALCAPLACGALAAETGHPLADAVRSGDGAAVRALLGNLGKSDLAGPEGTAALMAAADRNDLELADLLLRAGADPKGANDYGATALYAAAANADPAMTAKLLAAGAHPNAHLVSGETPLMAAAARGNIAVVRALLAAGADPNARETNGGQDALMWAASEHHPEVTDELVRHGADVNAKSNTGFTALMFAARRGDADSARILLGAEANPNEVAAKTGITALVAASAMGRTKAAALLLDHGADPNAVDATGFSALHYAALRKGATGIVTALLAHGANPNVRLHMAHPTSWVTGVSRQGATPVAVAAEINNLDAVEALVAGGADPRIPTEEGTTPLMLAAGAGSDPAGARPLPERATAVETARFLIDHGTDVNAAGQFGWTALHAASYQGLNDVVALLVAHGARLETQDGFGQTPLSIANAVVTKGLGGAYYQTPRNLKRDTSDLLLKLGALPLDKSGIIVVTRRAGE